MQRRATRRLRRRLRLAYTASMTETERNILQALLSLEDAVKRLPTANPKPDLVAMFAGIDALAAQLPAGADAELRHFLQRKSYEKARLHLQGRETEKGICGH